MYFICQRQKNHAQICRSVIFFPLSIFECLLFLIKIIPNVSNRAFDCVFIFFHLLESMFVCLCNIFSMTIVGIWYHSKCETYLTFVFLFIYLVIWKQYTHVCVCDLWFMESSCRFGLTTASVVRCSNGYFDQFYWFVFLFTVFFCIISVVCVCETHNS